MEPKKRWIVTLAARHANRPDQPFGNVEFISHGKSRTEAWSTAWVDAEQKGWSIDHIVAIREAPEPSYEETEKARHLAHQSFAEIEQRIMQQSATLDTETQSDYAHRLLKEYRLAYGYGWNGCPSSRRVDMLVRRYVVFTVPINRLDESRDGKPTWEALRRSLHITGAGLQRLFNEAKHRREYRIRFKCTLGQFATFLILRNQFGGANWFSELRPEIVDATGAPIEIGRTGSRASEPAVHDVTGESKFYHEFTQAKEEDWHDPSG